MRRLSFVVTAAAATCNQVQTAAPGTTSLSQTRGLKNLHQYRKERSKRLNKQQDKRFSIKWKLYAGNNHELYEFRGHEREATENFGRYKFDAKFDRYHFFTDDLSSFPPLKRIEVIQDLMRARWGVRDKGRGYDKMKLALAGLECYAQLKETGQVENWLELTESGQEGFLQMCDTVMQFAGRVVHDHPNAVGGMLRAAAIADLMGAHEKSEGMLRVSRVAAERLHEGYAFGRDKIIDEVDAYHKKVVMGKGDSWELEDKKLSHRMKFPYTREIVLQPFRPEQSSWMNSGIRGDGPNPERSSAWKKGKEFFPGTKSAGKSHMLPPNEDWL